jgi:flagellar biosynthesis protein FlhB
VAKIIRETALAEGIPVMEDKPLARALYAEGKLEDCIPETLIEPVAEVLKWAKQIQDARKEEEELDSVTLEELPPTETAESTGEDEETGESV